MSRPLNYFRTRSKIQPIDVNTYLEKLGLTVEEPTLNFLRKIHRAHLFNIPFENLDIHYNNRIELNVNTLYDKIIRQNRGGFCYELNTLVFHLLGNLGYRCYLVSAQVYQEGSWSPEFDHMALIVGAEKEKWLVDVGFGEHFHEPKRMVLRQSQLDYTTYYKFEYDIDRNVILKKSDDNSTFSNVYRFRMQPRELIEFIPRCNFHQESLDSHFKHHKIISQQQKNGRITLTDRKLKIQIAGETSESQISNEDEFLAKLEQHFGISPQDLIRTK
ncbi:arylamine N-acetyltransferase [Marinoscillum sp. MHG1-6]|uniref:arylamine N-acetyltransferase family protein n=1 Tax=Marinoscillum sp. MHG1-6 TaxID=2959627 RepID=UPI002157D9AD|nr:arylamine N-acetyltransferase [Marinoscillum sp. MHG1-6]